MQFAGEDAERFAVIHKLLRKHQLQVMGSVFNSQAEVDRAYEGIRSRGWDSVGWRNGAPTVLTFRLLEIADRCGPPDGSKPASNPQPPNTSPLQVIRTAHPVFPSDSKRGPRSPRVR
jgi:hypothetical protein